MIGSSRPARKGSRKNNSRRAEPKALGVLAPHSPSAIHTNREEKSTGGDRALEDGSPRLVARHAPRLRAIRTGLSERPTIERVQARIRLLIGTADLADLGRAEWCRLQVRRPPGRCFRCLTHRPYRGPGSTAVALLSSTSQPKP